MNLQLFRDYCGSSSGVDLLLVDDGSGDSTAQLLVGLAAEFPDRVHTLLLTRNSGKAEAVRAGFQWAFAKGQYGLLGFWDADLATPLPAVARFIEVLRRHPEYEMVFGSRVKLCGRHIERQPLRHYLGRVFATVVSIVLKIAIYDTQCGAKLFRVKPELVDVFTAPFVSRWIFDVEILARFIAKSSPAAVAAQIYEYPLERWTDVSGSKVRAKDFLRAISEILIIQRKYLSL